MLRVTLIHNGQKIEEVGGGLALAQVKNSSWTNLLGKVGVLTTQNNQPDDFRSMTENIET